VKLSLVLSAEGASFIDDSMPSLVDAGAVAGAVAVAVASALACAFFDFLVFFFFFPAGFSSFCTTFSSF